MRILFCSSDWAVQGPRDPLGHPYPGGAGWYRCRVPAVALQQMGHEVVHCANMAVYQPTGEILAHTWDEEVVGGFDVVVFQRWMSELAPDVIQRARAYGQVIIHDLDDYFWGLDVANKAWVGTHPYQKNGEVLGNRKTRRSDAKHGRIKTYTDGSTNLTPNSDNREHYRAGLAAASAVTVSTPYLGERVKRFVRQPIMVVRNAIDLDRWQPHPQPAGKPIIGWVGAVGWRSGDLEILRGVLGPFVEKHDLKVVHAGATSATNGAFAEKTGVDPERVTQYSMASIHTYPFLFSPIDISIAPLRDAPFNEAKSAIKVLESTAAGCAVVSSAMPEYDHFGIGMRCRKPVDWTRALEAMLDPAVRATSIEAAQKVLATQDIANRADDWAMAYQQLLSVLTS